MSRRDYVAVAAILKQRHRDVVTVRHINECCSFEAVAQGCVVDWIAADFANLYAAENPRFDRGRFLTACGVER